MFGSVIGLVPLRGLLLPSGTFVEEPRIQSMLTVDHRGTFWLKGAVTRRVNRHDINLLKGLELKL